MTAQCARATCAREAAPSDYPLSTLKGGAMNDDNRGDDPTNGIDFARRTDQTGFTLTPTTTMGPVIPPPPAAPPAPAPTGARAGRRSPLDALAALPAPGLTLPPVPAPAPGPQPGHVPATFRNEGDDGFAGTP